MRSRWRINAALCVVCGAVWSLLVLTVLAGSLPAWTALFGLILVADGIILYALFGRDRTRNEGVVLDQTALDDGRSDLNNTLQ